jgi:hypothetical protein
MNAYGTLLRKQEMNLIMSHVLQKEQYVVRAGGSMHWRVAGHNWHRCLEPPI